MSGLSRCTSIETCGPDQPTTCTRRTAPGLPYHLDKRPIWDIGICCPVLAGPARWPWKTCHTALKWCTWPCQIDPMSPNTQTCHHDPLCLSWCLWINSPIAWHHLEEVNWHTWMHGFARVTWPAKLGASRRLDPSLWPQCDQSHLNTDLALWPLHPHLASQTTRLLKWGDKKICQNESKRNHQKRN